jgi:hypothetical protein
MVAVAGCQHANREPWALAASTNCVHIAQGKPSVLKKGGGVTLFCAQSEAVESAARTHAPR